jgi:hypothetical protein
MILFDIVLVLMPQKVIALEGLSTIHLVGNLIARLKLLI